MDGFVPTENTEVPRGCTGQGRENATEEDVKRMTSYDSRRRPRRWAAQTERGRGQFPTARFSSCSARTGPARPPSSPDDGGQAGADEESRKIPSHMLQAADPPRARTTRQLHCTRRSGRLHSSPVRGRRLKTSRLTTTDQEVQNLSGGELQRVAMTLCLGKPATCPTSTNPPPTLYQAAVVAAKVIKRFSCCTPRRPASSSSSTTHHGNLYDRVIVYVGQPFDKHRGHHVPAGRDEQVSSSSSRDHVQA